MTTPNPTKAPATDPEAVARQQRLGCALRPGCLRTAARWRSFSCGLCHAYEPQDPAELALERAGLAALGRGIARGWFDDPPEPARRVAPAVEVHDDRRAIVDPYPLDPSKP